MIIETKSGELINVLWTGPIWNSVTVDEFINFLQTKHIIYIKKDVYLLVSEIKAINGVPFKKAEFDIKKTLQKGTKIWKS